MHLMANHAAPGARPRLLPFVTLAILILGSLSLAACRAYAFNGMVLQSPEKAYQFTLTGAGGQRVSLSDFEGKLVLLYFGYTHCPDVCPATLANLRLARNRLGEDADQVQVFMITVDPERDTPDIIGKYVASLDPSFVGLTGSPDEIAEVATYYGIFYEKEESTSAAGYLMAHTASVMLVDRDGYLRLTYPFGTSADDFAADLEYLIKRR